MVEQRDWPTRCCMLSACHDTMTNRTKQEQRNRKYARASVVLGETRRCSILPAGAQDIWYEQSGQETINITINNKTRYDGRLFVLLISTSTFVANFEKCERGQRQVRKIEISMFH